MRRRFVISGLYQLPFGKEGEFVSDVIAIGSFPECFGANRTASATLSTDPSSAGMIEAPNRIAMEIGYSTTHSHELARYCGIHRARLRLLRQFGPGHSGGCGIRRSQHGIARDFLLAERFRVQFRA